MQEEIIFGVVHNSGISSKTGKEYDFKQVLVAVEAKGVGAKGSGTGLMPKHRNIAKGAYEKLEAHKADFPIRCEVQYGFDGNDRLIVKDIKLS